MTILFHDFEVTKYDLMLVVIDPRTGQKWRFHNDNDAIKKFFYAHQKDLWIGYNCNKYDRYIMKAVLTGLDPWKVSNFIINEERKGWEYSDLFKEISIFTWDTQFTEHSLKALECSLGLRIVESSVSWDIDRPMTEEEVKETLEYCEYDVESTIKVFIEENANWKVYKNLIKKFNLPPKCWSMTKAQLAGEILQAHPVKRNDEYDIQFSAPLDLQHTEAIDWFKQPENLWLERFKPNGVKNKNPGFQVKVGDMDIGLGWGGVHGSQVKYFKKGKFIIADVGAYYPSIMIAYDLISRNCANKSRFKEVKEERMKIKHTLKDLSDALKVLLNTTYGASGYEFNKLYDPRNAHSVCVNGQLMLLELCEKICDLCELVNVNTDGIIIRVINPADEARIKDICEDWVKRTKMTLEYDTFDELMMKDVNNYIMIKDGKAIKRVGAYVKKSKPLDNFLRVVRDGVVQYLVHGVKPEDWVAKHDDLIDFQFPVRVGKTFDYTMHNGKVLNGRTFRVFASLDENDETLYKYKDGRPNKVGIAPEHCFIDNEDIRGKKIPEKLDKQFYVNMIYERANAFLE